MKNIKKGDFYKHYNLCDNEQIIFSYNGEFTSSILQGFVSVLEDRLRDNDVEKSKVRKIISIIIEFAQNIQHYSIQKTDSQDQEDGHGILVLRKEGEGIQIYSGNLVSQEKGEQLLRYCNQLKMLNQQSLKDLYLKKLKENREASSDRAGIGLLYIMRKSNSQMEIKVHPIDETSVLLMFSVLVN